MKLRPRRRSLLAATTALALAALPFLPDSATAAPLPSSLQLGSVVAPSGIGVWTTTDSSVAGGKVLAYGNNAGVTYSMANTAAAKVQVRAKGLACDGFSNVRIEVDGKALVNNTTLTGSYADYVSSSMVQPGTHQVRLVMSGDHWAYSPVRCSREMLVDTLGFVTNGYFAPTSFWNRLLPADAPLKYDSAANDALAKELLRQSGPGFSSRGFYSPGINTSSYTAHLYVVPANQPMVRVKVDKPYVSDLDNAFNPATGSQNGVPLPADALPSAGTDGEVSVYQPDWTDGTGHGTGRLYELWQFKPASASADGLAHASWGGRMSYVSTNPGHFVYRGNKASDPGYELAYWGTTATSLPLVGGEVRLSELQAGRIDHVIGVAPTYTAGYPNYVWPAQRTDGYYPAGYTGTQLPEGTRMRLPADFVINPTWPTVVQEMAQAAKDYGIVIWDRSGGTSVRFENPKPSDKVDGVNPYSGTDATGKQVVPADQTLFQGKAGWQLAQQFWTVAGPSMRTLSVGKDSSPN